MKRKSFQFSKDQAAAIFRSGIWNRWDMDMIIKMQLFQQQDLVPFAVFKEALFQKYEQEFTDIEIQDRGYDIKALFLEDKETIYPDRQFYWMNIRHEIFRNVA